MSVMRPNFLQSQIVSSIPVQSFGWTTSRGSSFCRAGTESAEGRESGFVAGDACYSKARAASSQATFDACPVVVGACGPLTG